MNISVSEFYALILRHLKFRRKKAANHDPFRDWEFVIGTSAVILVLLFAAGAYLFYQIAADHIFSVPAVPAETATSFNRTALDKAAGFYDAKEQAFQALGGVVTGGVVASSSTNSVNASQTNSSGSSSTH